MLVTSMGSSTTTERHKSKVRYAAYKAGYVVIEALNIVDLNDNWHEQNIKAMNENVATYKAKLSRARSEGMKAAWKRSIENELKNQDTYIRKVAA